MEQPQPTNLSGSQNTIMDNPGAYGSDPTTGAPSTAALVSVPHNSSNTSGIPNPKPFPTPFPTAAQLSQYHNQGFISGSLAALNNFSTFNSNGTFPTSGYMFPGLTQQPNFNLNRAFPATGYTVHGQQHPASYGIQPTHSYQGQIGQSTSGSAQFTGYQHPTGQGSSSSLGLNALYQNQLQQFPQGSAAYQQFQGIAYTNPYPYAFGPSAAFANQNMDRSNAFVNEFPSNIQENFDIGPADVAFHGFDDGNIEAMEAVISSPMIGPHSLGAPLTKFTCFMDLPPEIRVDIWQLCLPGPRIIEVKLKKIYGRYADEHGKGKRQVYFPEKETRFVSNAIPPALLFVCHESRGEALRQYEAVFPTKKCPAQIYVNFKLDTIILANVTYLPLNSRSKVQLRYEFSQIRYFAIMYSDTTKTLARDIFGAMPNLKELILFVDNRGIIDPVRGHDPLMLSPYSPGPGGLLAQEIPLYKRDISVAFRKHCAAVGKSNSASCPKVTVAEVYRDMVEILRQEGKPWDYVPSEAHPLTLAQAKDMALTRMDRTWKTLEEPILRIRGFDF